MADPDAGDGVDSGDGAGGASASDADESPYGVAPITLFETVGPVEDDVRAIEAAVAGGLAGGLHGALVIQLFDTDAIKRVGAIVGSPTLDGGWLTMFALGVLLALPFHPFVSRAIDAFVPAVLALSRRSERLRSILAVTVRRSALTTTAFGLGNGYGIAVGVVFSLLVAPPWSPVATSATTSVRTVVELGFIGVVAWTVYGATLGLVYGLLLESR